MRRSKGWAWSLGAVILGLALGLGVWVNQAFVAEYKYVGASKCKNCHRKKGSGEAYQKWEQGPHAKALKTLATPKAKEAAQKAGIKGDPQKEPKCLKCHVTAYGADAKLLAKTYKVEDGIQCESCHGPGSGYRKKKIMIDKELAKKNGLIIPAEKTCTVCHNSESPSWDPNQYTVAGGKKVGLDFEQAKKKIAHPTPEEYKKKVKTEKEEEEEED